MLYLPSLMNETPAFYVRDVPIYGDTILAPMDGYSDWPFRSICRALGSAMSYTEFVKVEKILSRSKEPPRGSTTKKWNVRSPFRSTAMTRIDPIKAALKVQELNPDISTSTWAVPPRALPTAAQVWA